MHGSVRSIQSVIHVASLRGPLWGCLGGLLLVGCLAGCGAEEHAERATAPAEQRSALFTDVTAEAGLSTFRHETGAFGKKWFPETVGSGGAFIDYDGDGWLDVLLAGGGTWPGTGKQAVPALWLYRNEARLRSARRRPGSSASRPTARASPWPTTTTMATRISI
jgi:hypothetical protein